MRLLIPGLALLGVTLALAVGSCQVLRVGPLGSGYVQADGSFTDAAGPLVTIRSKPVDFALSPNRKWAAVKDDAGVELVDLTTMKVLSEWKSSDGMSAVGIAFPANDSLYTTTAGRLLVHLEVSGDGILKESQKIDVGEGYPNGVVIDGERAFVALSTKNQVVEIDLRKGGVTRTLDVGTAPFDMALDSERGELWVGEQGGIPPSGADLSAKSAGTPVKVDVRGIAMAGALARVDLKSWKVVSQTPTPTLPSKVLVDSGHHQTLVACANGDAIVTVDIPTGEAKTIPMGGAPGAFPTGLCLSGGSLFVTLSGRNQVKELTWAESRWRPGKVLRTDWFPVEVAPYGSGLLVLSAKGLGTRSPEKPGIFNTYDYTGALRLVAKSGLKPDEPLAPHLAPQVPAIQHIVYVIKENRTYDQLFGDIAAGDGDPKLCQFGIENTPNQHAIANTWVLLDNYYCSGVLSADGHSWATEGNSTPYLERSFGGFKRSYTFGDDPLTYSSTGFLWDAVLDKGLSFRNYGEFDYAEPKGGLKGLDLYKKSLDGSKLDIGLNIGVQRVKDHSCSTYPGWNLDISDQYRMDRFEDEFLTMKQSGKMPALTVLYLPQDHTGGPVSPQAHVADNDLAVGRLIDKLSHSDFWKDTVVFVTEDDPQAGTDHVDGHRSICLVAGGRVKRGVTLHTFYTQASVLHTICAIFDLPALNGKTALAPPMTDVFQEDADLTPFRTVKETLSLSHMPVREGLYAQTVRSLDLSKHEVQTVREMDSLNRAIWSETRPGTLFPAELAGAHGHGLAAKGLSSTSVEDADGDGR